GAALWALKVAGERAHDLARQGKDVALAARTVRIGAIRVLGYEWPWLDVEIDCGKGTYIRSIARDLGTKLGCGGMVQTLRRTRVGPFTAEQGIGLEVSPEGGRGELLPMSAAGGHLPRVVLEPEDARRLFHRQTVRAAPRPGQRGGTIPVAVMTPGMKLFAIGEDSGSGVLRPVIVFANPEG